MRRLACSLRILALALLPSLQAEVTTVVPQEEKQWIRHVLPLPHEIAIKRKCVVSARDIVIQLRENAGPLELQAASELEQLFQVKTGAVPSGNRFRILVGVLNSQGRLGEIIVNRAQKLTRLPNADQAYLVQPYAENALLLVAPHPKGVYYAARTVCQLLEPSFLGQNVSIPLAEIVDWPDMAERGIWNFPQAYEPVRGMPAEWIPWLASLKLNYGEMPHSILNPVERGKTASASIDTKLLQAAQRRAFNYLPPITHLNFLHDFGLYRAYPELAGQGDEALAGRYSAHKQGNSHRVPYAAHPLLRKVLSEWMTSLASQGAEEVICWLSERPAEDQHLETMVVGQAVLEARACVGAWRDAQRQYPRLGLRVFLSTTTTGRYYRVIAELPPEVKVLRACATGMERVAHLPRDLFRNPLLDQYAIEGRWIGSYDVPVTANDRVETPEFMVPESSAHRIKDYVGQLVGRRYRGAAAMMAWSNVGQETCGFNISALAEWTWNLHGRSEKEFSIAWATRERFENPDAVGEWSELMGPVEFDVYDSDFPVSYSWGKFTRMIQTRQRPVLGEGIFRYYANDADFDTKLALCNRALAISSRFRSPHLANETKVVMSYVGLAKSMYRVAELAHSADFTAIESQRALRAVLEDLDRAGRENVGAIRSWRTALGPEPWHSRVHDAMKATETTVQQIADWLSARYLY
ncbi:MAG: hypothetical protein LLG20_11325 [Acidobacteriales bacterium]|nr:hypothetical protein [Terriglobales bacterium]